MKKRLISLVTAAFMLTAMAGCGKDTGSSTPAGASTTAGTGSSSSISASSIKVGVLLSTTGNFSISETPMKNAAQMAIDEINAAGGIAGIPIEPIYMDYGSDPAMAAEKAQKLIIQDKVTAIVGTNSSSTRLAVIPTIEQYDSLLIYNTFYEGEKPSPNVLYTNTCPSQQVAGFMPFITENIGKKIFFVGSDYEFPRNTVSYAKDLLISMGGEVVGEEYAPSGTTDFSSIVNKIKAAKPDVIFSAVAGNDSVYFYTDCSNYGIDMATTPICSVACHEGTIKGIGEAAIGSYSCFSYINTLDTPASNEFKSKYESLFGTETTVNNGAEATYRGVYILAKAIEKAGSLESADIVAAAAGIEIDAPSGKIRMDDSNHHAWLNTYIGKVNSDIKFDIIASSDGLVAPVVD